MTTRSLALFVLAALTTSAAAQPTPLKWGADTDGGVPYAFLDIADGGKIVGFEADIAQALARELGRPIEFTQFDFKSLLPALDRGDIDLAMNGIEILPEREENYLFTKPYYVYQLQYVVLRDSAFKTVDEIEAGNVTVATLTGSSAERYLKDKKIKYVDYDDQNSPFLKLRDGDVGAVLLDLPIALYYGAPDAHLKYGQHPKDFRYLGNPFAEGYYGIAFRKKDVELRDKVDAALDRLRDSGELKRILSKWELWNADQYRLANLDSIRDDGSSRHFTAYLRMLLEGAWMTIQLSVCGMALAVLLALPIALLRLYAPAPLAALAIGYIEFFRGIPVLLLLYFVYFGLPAVIGLKLGAFEAAILAFGLNYAAYEAEIYRTGFSSIPVGQWEAAASVGMGPIRTFFRIILPQAIRVILPPMTNDFVALFKDTSLVSIIGLTELSKTYQSLTKSGGGFVEIGLLTAALYLIMSVPLGLLSRYLERRWGTA